jgi:hypothetical protein
MSPLFFLSSLVVMVRWMVTVIWLTLGTLLSWRPALALPAPHASAAAPTTTPRTPRGRRTPQGTPNNNNSSSSNPQYTIVLTGGTAGIGLAAAARILETCPGAHLVLPCRDLARGGGRGDSHSHTIT